MPQKCYQFYNADKTLFPTLFVEMCLVLLYYLFFYLFFNKKITIKLVKLTYKFHIFNYKFIHLICRYGQEMGKKIKHFSYLST